MDTVWHLKVGREAVCPTLTFLVYPDPSGPLIIAQRHCTQA